METRRPSALVDTPPVWLLAFAFVAWAQARWLPLVPADRFAAWLGLPSERPRILGIALALVGIIVLGSAALEFRRFRTSIVPRETPVRLLRTGPYSVTRNPIYIADALFLAAVVLWLDLAALVLVPLFLWLVRRRFIDREEAACRAAFGAEWERYAARVPRWLGASGARRR